MAKFGLLIFLNLATLVRDRMKRLQYDKYYWQIKYCLIRFQYYLSISVLLHVKKKNIFFQKVMQTKNL